MTVSDIYLLVGPNRQKIDSSEIVNITILNLSVKDIRNYGQRNTAFTKPISILHTMNTQMIFGSLFNINTLYGYDPGVKIYGELVKNGITLLSGSIQVVEITGTTYEVVLSGNNINLFNSMGEKLITGNSDPSDNITFDASLYFHKWSRDEIRASLNKEPSTGDGYFYPIVNYDNKMVWPVFDFNPLQPNIIRDDYLMFPAIPFKLVFDKIFEKYGFSYQDNSYTPLLDKLWIAFNDDYLKYTTDYQYAKYYLGSPADYGASSTTVGLTSSATSSWFYTQVIPIYSVKGFTFYDTSIAGTDNDVAGGFDTIRNCPSTYHTKDYYIQIPHAGEFILDVSMWLYNTAGTQGTTEWSFTVWNETQGNVAYSIGSLDIPGNSGAYLQNSVNFKITEKSSLCVHRSTGSSSSINLIFGSWSNIKITEKNSFFNGDIYFDMNSMLPKNYKQKDLVNDYLKMINAFITNGNPALYEENVLFIRPYIDYYSEDYLPKTYNWTDKINFKTIRIEPTKNIISKTIQLKFTDDTDSFNADYATQYPEPIYTKTVTNDSQFATDVTDIQLSTSPGIMTKVPGTVGTNLLFPTPTGGLKVLNISGAEGNFKTAWKPRVLFSNSIDISAFVYGSDASFAADPCIRKWNTLSPREYWNINSGLYDGTGNPIKSNFLGFDSKNTYLAEGSESNINLYNVFYKSDIESQISRYSYILKADAYLSEVDIKQIQFNDTIYIENDKMGSGYFHINAINNYTPEKSIASIELLKINEDSFLYPDEVSTNLINGGTVWNPVMPEPDSSICYISFNNSGNIEITSLNGRTVDVSIYIRADAYVDSYYGWSRETNAYTDLYHNGIQINSVYAHASCTTSCQDTQSTTVAINGINTDDPSIHIEIMLGNYQSDQEADLYPQGTAIITNAHISEGTVAIIKSHFYSYYEYGTQIWYAT